MDQDSKEAKKLAKEIRALLYKWGHGEYYRSHAEKRIRELGSLAVPVLLQQLAEAKSAQKYFLIDLATKWTFLLLILALLDHFQWISGLGGAIRRHRCAFRLG